MSSTPFTGSDPELPLERPPTVSVDLDAELQLARLLEEYAGEEPTVVDFREWDVEGRLGSGGMGTVYLARDKRLGRRVALKILKPSLGATAAMRFIREAQALAQIRHDNVLQIHRVDTAGTRAVIEMEYIEGPTLRVWQSDPARSWRMIVDAYVSVGNGLSALHDAGLLHRDIKPDNLLMDAGGRVKIVDLGLAVAIRDAKHQGAGTDESSSLALQITADGAIVGTLGYMAPEVIAGAPATAASDQFSLAVSLFEAVYGVAPFRGESPEALAEAIRRGSLTKPSDGRRRPVWLLRALRRASSFNPSDRYPSVAEFVRALRRGLWRRKLFLMSGVLLGALAGLPAMGWYLKPATPDPCVDAGSAIFEIWNDDVRSELASRTDTHENPQAERSLAALEFALDSQTALWSATRVNLCVSELAHHQAQAPEIEFDLDLRQAACLDYARVGMAAVVEQLRESNHISPRHYMDSAAAVVALPTCEDRRALANAPPVPTDEKADMQLARAAATEAAGKYPEAQAIAQRIVDSSATSDPYRHAEALYRVGHVLGMERRDEQALDVLNEARRVAFSNGLDELFCRTLAFQAKLRAVVERTPRAARSELDLAHACVERVGARSPLLRAELLEAEGLLAQATGDAETAVVLHEEVLALRRSHFGDGHPDTAKSLHNLANALSQTGDPARSGLARQRYEDCIELRTRLLGDNHPELADVLFDFGLFLRDEGETERARKLLERALTMHEQAGTLDVIQARVHMSLAVMDIEASDLVAAAEQLERARPAFDGEARIDHIDRARYLHLAGVLALQNQDFGEAADALRRAGAEYHEANADPAERLDAVGNEIEADSGLGDFARIAAIVRDEGKDLDDYVRGLEPANERGALAWRIGEALSQRAAHIEAVKYLGIALEAYETMSDTPSVNELRTKLNKQTARTKP